MSNPEINKERFCQLVIRNQEAMFRTARAILQSDEDAEDAVQDAICAAFASRTELRDPEKFKPWILRILTNKCYDTCRKRKPTVDLADVQDFLPAPDTDHVQRLSLWQAVLSLAADTRAAVTLFYYDGLSIREISHILGISEAAVKARLSRGRARLKLLLQEQ
jgi:RNA polymerase sigma-70 factor (ECF subfamily)